MASVVEPMSAKSVSASGTLRQQDCEVKLFLAPEVVVDHPFRGPGPFCDLVDPSTCVAVLGEYLSGDGEQLSAGAFRVAHPLRDA